MTPSEKEKKRKSALKSFIIIKDLYILVQYSIVTVNINRLISTRLKRLTKTGNLEKIKTE